MKKYLIDIFAADKADKVQNDMAHATGIFEPGKIFCNYAAIATMSPNCSKDLITAICTKIESEGGYVVFAGVRLINNRRPKEPVYHMMQGVHTLAMRMNIFNNIASLRFVEALAIPGWYAEHDENYIVKSVKLRK